MESPSHQRDGGSLSIDEIGVVGLNNLGNTSFMNSILQCLSNTKLLTDYFLSDTYSTEINTQNPLGSGGKLAISYANLMKSLWGGVPGSSMADFRRTIGEFAPSLLGYEQYDSFEFMMFLLDGLHEDLNRIYKKPYTERIESKGRDDVLISREAWRRFLLRNDSEIIDKFFGQLRSQMTCPHCGHESVTFDEYCSLSLPLPTHNDDVPITVTDTPSPPNTSSRYQNLFDCMRAFIQRKQLSSLEIWYCPNCEQHVQPIQKIDIWTAPDILILRLKRFESDEKRTDLIEFPIQGLDLTEYVKNISTINEEAPPIYDLYGVSEHAGNMGGGHSTATVMNPINMKWYSIPSLSSFDHVSSSG